MRKSTRRLMVATTAALAAVLTVGVTAAVAHGPGFGLRGQSQTALVNEAAKQLGVTSAKLRSAIVDAAIARVDEAVADDELEADEATEAKDEARDSLRYAIALSRTRTVASNLGITAARLNTAFREARRALIIARIDEAVEDGDLDADEAAELKEEVADTRLPGYKPVAFGREGRRGFDRGFDRGFGFGGGLGFRP